MLYYRIDLPDFAMKTAPTSPHSQPTSEPAWEIAKLFPNQSYWSEQEYLRLNGNRPVEFTHGRIEVLCMPTDLHQAIVAALFESLLLFGRPAVSEPFGLHHCRYASRRGNIVSRM